MHINATSSLCTQYLGYTLGQFISCCVFGEEHDTPCQIFPRPRENLDNVHKISQFSLNWQQFIIIINVHILIIVA